MPDDRFANVFTAKCIMTAANTLSFAEMNFGITIRDKIGLVLDEIYIYPYSAMLAEMTASGDAMQFGIVVSDTITSISDLADRRILWYGAVYRHDFGTAAGGSFLIMPLKYSFSPPLVTLPNRLFFAVASSGLASAGTAVMRLHFRTTPMTSEAQLMEIMESMQLST